MQSGLRRIEEKLLLSSAGQVCDLTVRNAQIKHEGCVNMPFAILRFAKMKGGPAKSLEAHHERKKTRYASNPDVDLSRSDENFHMITPQFSYYYEIQSRIEKAKCKVRKDSVKFIDTIITASPEFFKNRPPREVEEFFRRAVDFLSEEVGRQNIFSAVVHMDERTPHMHLCFVPLTKDNRLSAKEVLGDRVKLTAWQDKFHAHMLERFEELERGESAIETKRMHIPVRLFKQATALTQQRDEIQLVLDGINPINAGKKKEKALELMKKYYDGLRSFNSQLKQVERGNKDLQETISNMKGRENDLERRLYREQQGHKDAVNSMIDLREDYDDCMAFVRSIPKELRKQLVERYEYLRTKEQDMEFEL